MSSSTSCQTDPAWQATQEAWSLADTDTNAASWWSNITAGSYTSFANELGKDFGGHLNAFECGIDAYSTCVAPPCSSYTADNDPAWSYELILGTVNLNKFYNDLYTGITSGQTDYEGIAGDMAQVFFPWKSPTFVLGDAAFWIVAILAIIFAVPATFLGLAPELAFTVAGISTFTSAGVQQMKYSLTPDPINSQMTLEQGEAQLDKFATQVGQTTRQGIADWANSTFRGDLDLSGKGILDYLYDGSFAADANLPSVSQMENFYKTQMVSRKINNQWKTQKVFIMFFQTDDPDDVSGPAETKYYSADDGGVYYLYWYQEDGVLKGELEKPWGLDHLNDKAYGIAGTDITKASARAFRYAGFNYTDDIAQQRISDSIASNGTLTPFQDGPGWEGTWSIPVCDTGSHNWQSQYGKNGSMGSLPCCCGENCTDTATFVKAANLVGFQTLLRGCKAQLHNTDLSYNDIDYGFKWLKSLPLVYAGGGPGIKAGIIIGMIIAGCLGIIASTGLAIAACGD